MTPDDVPDGPVLVDTDVATWLLMSRGRADEWRALLRGHPLVLSFVNMGELLAILGPEPGSTRRAREWREGIRQTFTVVAPTIAVAELWAPMHAKYSGHMQKGGSNDLWIAATALAASPQLPLATGNLSDFGKLVADHSLQLIHPDL